MKNPTTTLVIPRVFGRRQKYLLTCHLIVRWIYQHIHGERLGCCWGHAVDTGHVDGLVICDGAIVVTATDCFDNCCYRPLQQVATK